MERVPEGEALPTSGLEPPTIGGLCLLHCPIKACHLVLFVRRRVCQYAPCGQVFYICVHCDRGQVCCSEKCGYDHRRNQCNEADRRYQNTRKGRLAHNKRQRAYNRRQRLARADILMQKVTDQGLGKPRLFVTVNIAEGITSQMTKQPTSMGQAIEKNPRHGLARCCVCGRLGFPPPLRR